ncbi:heparin lyase I family protein [Tsukamurella ocularis]|uniref:heparin lyase I family protein n=1 Tax=Tsukamurella ocularis TaxID=1970234 RepID=UPI0039F0C396
MVPPFRPRHVRRRLAYLSLCVATTTVLASCGGDAPAPLWSGDFETGSLSEFAAPTPGSERQPAPTLESETVAAGRNAVAFTLEGDQMATSLLPGTNKTASLAEGDDLWFSWYLQLDRDFPEAAEDFQILSEWKNSGLGTAPLALVIDPSGTFKAQGGFGHPDGNRASAADLGTARRGAWIAWTWHVVFSTDPQRARVSIWMDDKEVAKDWRPLGGTLYPATNARGENPNKADGPFSTWRIGYFRPAGVQAKGTVYFDALRVGTSRESVRLPALNSR